MINDAKLIDQLYHCYLNVLFFLACDFKLESYLCMFYFRHCCFYLRRNSAKVLCICIQHWNKPYHSSSGLINLSKNPLSSGRPKSRTTSSSLHFPSFCGRVEKTGTGKVPRRCVSWLPIRRRHQTNIGPLYG